MALKDSPSAPVVRPPINDVVILKRLLDAGFYNFLIPFVESAREARQAVAATRYPPAGIRGVWVAQRSNRYGTVPDYFITVNEQICVLVQIESRAGMENLDEICAVDGVDGIFIGPSDLAAALGHLGNPNHADVQQAIRHIFARGTPRAFGRCFSPSGGRSSALPGGRSLLCRGRQRLESVATTTQALCDRLESHETSGSNSISHYLVSKDLAGIHNIMRIDCALYCAHDAHRVTVLGKHEIDLATADSMLSVHVPSRANARWTNLSFSR